MGVVLLLSALKQNTEFFHHPSDVLADGFVPKSSKIRVGGLVLAGSVEKSGQITTHFQMADFIEGQAPELSLPALAVSYSGILPDLFREGDGVVVTGALNEQGRLIASKVLAKHDENYQPDID
jgi:cytochrome c-type biogenesis protein CcmE